jgi:hypothetical protein
MKMDKHSGPAPWKILFAYVCGLINNSSSVNKISNLVSESPVMQMIIGLKVLGQTVLSRFMSRDADWLSFAKERMNIFLSSDRMKLSPGDVIALDDTKIDHPHGKNIPFLCWLFDSSDKRDVYCMNLVTTMAILKSGLEFPLSWRFWRKKVGDDPHKSKIQLVQEMLSDLRRTDSQTRLWVAMDRWFLCKKHFLWLEAHNFDWVTKAKTTTALFQLTGYDSHGKPRFKPVNAKQLLLMQANYFVGKKHERVAVAIPNIYMKMPDERMGKRGKIVVKQVYVQIAAVAVCRLPEDIEERTTLTDNSCSNTVFRGTHLIISNRYDAPDAVVSAYVKRWKIEVFYRAAKQELGLTGCHAESELAHFAHVEMLFIAETFVRLAMKEFEDSKEQGKGDDDVLTHGKVIQGLFIASIWTEVVAKHGKPLVLTKFDTTSDIFSRIIFRLWPKFIQLIPWPDCNLFQATA